MDGCIFNVSIGYQKFILKKILMLKLAVRRNALTALKHKDELFNVILLTARHSFILGVDLKMKSFKTGKRCKNIKTLKMKMTFPYFVRAI